MSALKQGPCALCTVTGPFELVVALQATGFYFGVCNVCTSLLASKLPGEPFTPELEQIPAHVRNLLHAAHWTEHAHRGSGGS